MHVQDVAGQMPNRLIPGGPYSINSVVPCCTRCNTLSLTANIATLEGKVQRSHIPALRMGEPSSPMRPHTRARDGLSRGRRARMWVFVPGLLSLAMLAVRESVLRAMLHLVQQGITLMMPAGLQG